MKERLDILVVKKGLAPSREKAKAMIMEGLVLVDGQREDKPGSFFTEEACISLKAAPLPYVSRGGLKLEKALRVFDIKLNGLVCMDIGSSTGGFTDCMLQNGAEKVYCVDVGYGQLDWKLRTDPRVVCMEKTNARYLTRDSIEELPDFFSVDTSFISLTKLLNVIYNLSDENAKGVALIKPQFEAGREKVGKKGVVRDPGVHVEVITRVAQFAIDLGFFIRGIDFSPIKGPEGNIEYLIHIVKRREEAALKGGELQKEIFSVVERSHGELD